MERGPIPMTQQEMIAANMEASKLQELVDGPLPIGFTVTAKARKNPVPGRDKKIDYLYKPSSKITLRSRIAAIDWLQKHPSGVTSDAEDNDEPSPPTAPKPAKAVAAARTSSRQQVKTAKAASADVSNKASGSGGSGSGKAAHAKPPVAKASPSKHSSHKSSHKKSSHKKRKREENAPGPAAPAPSGDIYTKTNEHLAEQVRLLKEKAALQRQITDDVHLEVAAREPNAYQSNPLVKAAVTATLAKTVEAISKDDPVVQSRVKAILQEEIQGLNAGGS